MTHRCGVRRIALRFSLFAGLAASLAPVGCLGTAGLIAGPVSGPISAWREDQGCFAMVVAVPLGMYLGFVRGLEKDRDFFAHGSYVAPGTMLVSEVFDPVAHLKSPHTYPLEPPSDTP